MFFYKQSGYETLGYTKKDLDNDGIDELIFGVTVNKDGTIANEGSSGAAYSNWTYFKYSNAKLDMKETVYTDDKGARTEVLLCY